MINNQYSTQALPTPSTLCKQIHDIEQQIMQYCQYANYHKQIIQINQDYINTFYIPSKINTTRVIYIGHGFGGSSLMYFPVIDSILQYGSVVLWEIRGLGLNTSTISNNYTQMLHIQQYYFQAITAMLLQYKFNNIVFISHSFGAYLTYKYLLTHQNIQYTIDKCILLSPIGMTAQDRDYKNCFKGYQDILQYISSWVAWKYNMTYHSLLKCLTPKIRQVVLRKFLSKYQLNQEELNLEVKLFSVLANAPHSSSQYFYRMFEKRVLPTKNESIEEMAGLIQGIQFQTVIYYGGEMDWVDKQGSKYLSHVSDKITVHKLTNCGHMLPLHVKIMRKIFHEQLGRLKK